MDIFFQDPNEVPLPPGEVRIRELSAEPWPDGQRVRVTLEVEPFQKRPNADLRIVDLEGREVATASVIETMVRKMELTMHLRGGQPGGKYTLSATLFYTESEEQDSTGDQGELREPPRQIVTVVDEAEIRFEISPPIK